MYAPSRIIVSGLHAALGCRGTARRRAGRTKRVLATACWMEAVEPRLLLAAPANDMFTQAAAITATATVSGSNVDATKEALEPSHVANPGGHSVWWQWTAPADALATLDTFGSDFDTLLAVYTGTSVSVEDLTQVAANDDWNGLQSLVQIDAASGITYFIAVDGVDGEVGNIALNLAVVELVPTFSLSAPASGSSYVVGDKVTIQWAAESVPSNSTISLCADADATYYNGNDNWLTINNITATNGTGSYQWDTTGYKPGTYGLGGYMYSSTSSTFSAARSWVTLVPTFTLTAPAPGAQYYVGNIVRIAWTASGIVPGSTISLCADSDSTYYNGNDHWLTVDTIPATNDTGFYDWNTTGWRSGYYQLGGYLHSPASTTFAPLRIPIALWIGFEW